MAEFLTITGPQVHLSGHVPTVPARAPDLVAAATGMAAARVTDQEQLDEAVRTALASPGPFLLDVVTNPEELALPPKTSIDQAWGFAIAKVKEEVVSRGAKG